MAAPGGGAWRRYLLLTAGAAAGVTAAVLLALQRRRRQRRTAVTKLLRYPVKSCGQEELAQALVLPMGFQGDRAFQVTDAQGNYCTPRDEDKARLFRVACVLTPQ